MQHRLEYLLFQLIRWSVLILPLKSAQRLGAYLGMAGYQIASSRRRITLENLRQAFPEMSEPERIAIAKGAFRNYLISLVEFLWFPNLTDERLRNLVKVRNPEVMTSGYARGKGMVMLSGHFGNWELIAFGVARLVGIPIAIIVQTQSNRLIDSVLNRCRTLLGNSTIPMGMSVRGIIKTLDDRGVVAIAPDQSGPIEGVFVDFFGRSVATHQGPAAFVLRSGAPMQMGFIIRNAEGTYDVTFEEIRTSDLTGATEENILELTRRHTALLERYIRMYPDHWLWMHRRWKHTWESVHPGQQPVDGAHA